MATVCLILPTATYRATAYLSAARRLGLEVVTASEAPQAMAGAMGEHFLEIPLGDPTEAARRIVERSETIPLTAVVSVDDQGLLAAALASEKLGLRHSPTEAVRVTRDKATMRRLFAAAHLPQPAFRVVEEPSPAAVVAAARDLGYPVVVKPVSLSGSRGVIRADDDEASEKAARRIRRILAQADEGPEAPLLVEEFVPGGEVALEGVLSAGRLEVVTVFDKPDPLEGPFFEETIYLAPSGLAPAQLHAVEESAAAAIAAIGLTEGPVHVELRLPRRTDASPDGVSLLEVAARTIGGRCARALDLSGGRSLEELVLVRASGLNFAEVRLAHPAGVLMIPIPGSGVLVRVEGTEEVRQLPGVSGVEITVPPGRRVDALPEGDRYLGFVFAGGPDRSEVERSLRRAKDLLRVVIAEVSDEPVR